MENDILKKKDPFPKNMSDACKLLNGWRYNFGRRSVHTEANDGMAFVTKSKDKDEQEITGKKKIVDVFCNARLLHNIWDAKRQLVLHCNAGTTLGTKKDDLRGYCTVWFYPMRIANILSLYNVSKKY